jgi:hypothetical protein
LHLEHFIVWNFWDSGRFVAGMFYCRDHMYWDVLYLGRCYAMTFCLGTLCRSTFKTPFCFPPILLRIYMCPELLGLRATELGPEGRKSGNGQTHTCLAGDKQLLFILICIYKDSRGAVKSVRNLYGVLLQ